MEKLFGTLRRKKVSIGKELISKAYHSRAEPSVTYSQLTRSYFCVTFPICNFRAAFTSNYPAASRNLPFPPPFPPYISLLIPCLSRPSNFAPLSLSHISIKFLRFRFLGSYKLERRKKNRSRIEKLIIKRYRSIFISFLPLVFSNSPSS